MASICRESKKASKRKFFEDREGTVDSQKIRKLDKEKTPKTPEKASKEKEKFGMMDMDEEAMLEKLVLGDLSSVLDKLGEDNDRFPRLIMDTEGDSGVEEGVSTPEDDEEDEEPSTSCKQPAWHDEEDSHLCIQEALRTQNRKQTIKFPGNSSDAYTGILQQRFNNIVGTPKWAQLEDKEEDEDSTDSDDEILQHCGKFISKSSSALPRGVLSIKRVLDLNSNTRTEGPIISAVHFHPKSSVALVAGLSGIASILQVDGEKNNKLHSVQFQRFPISTAKFTIEGNDFLVGSRELPYYYRYDMLEGRSLKVQPQTVTPITYYSSDDARLNTSVYQVVNPSFDEHHSRIIALMNEAALWNYVEERISLVIRQEHEHFVRRVYALTFVMILANYVCVNVGIRFKAVRHFLHKKKFVYVISYVVFFAIHVTIIAMDACSSDEPFYKVLLTVQTFALGYMLARIASRRSLEASINAILGTSSLTLLVTVFVAEFCSCEKWDVTGHSLFFSVVTASLSIPLFVAFAIRYTVFRKCKGWLIHLVLTIAVMHLSACLIYNTQLIMGYGVVELDSSEHVCGAIRLWLNIVNIFICLLLFARKNKPRRSSRRLS